MVAFARTGVLVLLTVTVAILLAAEAAADLTIYNDRAAWEADLICPHYLEDFESDELGTHWTPYTTGNGLSVTTTGAPIGLGIYANGPIDDTQIIHFRNFCDDGIGEGLTFSFPDGALQLGFGFDYHVLEDTWELRVAGEVIIIDENSQGFIGVIDETGSLADFLFYCDEYVQNGLTLDNVAYSPDCTVGDLRVYHDRETWEAELSCPVFLEDFESELLGVYETPYTTGNGFFISTTGAPIGFGVYPNSWVDDSQYIHFRNFAGRMVGEGLTFTFPDAALQYGFGFDYRVSDDTWELRVASEVIIIEDNTEGFIGVIDDTGSLADFLFYCDEYVQNGLSVDNIGHSPYCTTQVRQITWGRFKSLYR